MKLSTLPALEAAERIRVAFDAATVASKLLVIEPPMASNIIDVHKVCLCFIGEHGHTSCGCLTCTWARGVRGVSRGRT